LYVRIFPIPDKVLNSQDKALEFDITEFRALFLYSVTFTNKCILKDMNRPQVLENCRTFRHSLWMAPGCRNM